MRPIEILSCLGLPADDRRVQNLLQQFQITRSPEVETDPLSDEVGEVQDWLANLQRGIEFGFEDEASFLGAPPVEWGEGPMLLTQIYFYAAHPAAAPYEGGFPFDLRLGDDRASIRAQMQRSGAELRWRERDTWPLQGFDFTVDYGSSSVFHYAVAILRPPILAPDPEALARCPSVAELAAMLGRPLSDAQLDATLARTGYARALQALDPSLMRADLRDDLGLELQFGVVKDVQGLALDRITLLGDRRFGARNWPGELPRALRFGASWQEIIAAMGEEPEAIAAEDFQLTAVWHRGVIGIEIEYSTMTNSLLAVDLVYRV
ncbi:hypothetical protein Q9295_11840 [Xinfangfangia sp. CPCC 101601]|uniref:DUF1963 domain-containing protein n=1 Tax=Pseudogemmobacter lacusdianii TaxID=3069608 RepID=A0ABU0VZA0_9RHOB|nr:hypothetical protein [Xinfangfangia sp. CPCC 101601]MDQ2067071.1 hypothetical protein [Xinfangfangia sp. CPCC 101601]